MENHKWFGEEIKDVEKKLETNLTNRINYRRGKKEARKIWVKSIRSSQKENIITKIFGSD